MFVAMGFKCGCSAGLEI